MERGVAARPCPYPSPFASRSLRSREAKPSPARGEGERLATLPSPEQRGGDVVLLEDAERVGAQAMARAAAERAGAAEPEAEMLGPRAPPGKLVVDGLAQGKSSGGAASLATKRTSSGFGSGGGTRRTSGRSSGFMIASSFAALGRRNRKDRMG